MSGFGSITAGDNITLTSISASAITASYISASTYYGLPGGGGSTNPGGSDKQVQFNDGGSTFGGSSNLTYDKTTSTLSSSIAQFTTITSSTAQFTIITGSTARFTTITGSTITGSTAQFTTVTASNLSSSAAIRAGTTITAGTSVTVGAGDAVTKMKVYNVTFSSWNSVAASTTVAQTGTLSSGSFSGLSTSDTLFVNGTSAQQWATSSCILFNVSASTNQAWFVWRNLGATFQTPPTGTYKVFAITT